METRYWSRRPGKFVDYTTGEEVTGATFSGTVREWYETLVETVIGIWYGKNVWPTKIVAGQIANTILECSVLHVTNPDGTFALINGDARILLESNDRQRTNTVDVWAGDVLLGKVIVTDCDIVATLDVY